MLQSHLMTLVQDKQWRALLTADFLGAFNDNAFKMLVTFVVLDKSLNHPLGSLLLSLCGIVFVLPFLIFATYAGFIADRFSKNKLIIVIKFTEILIMGFAVFALTTGHLESLLILLFCMGTHSAFYGPPKYGIIPEVVQHEQLSQANGMVQMVTYAAIILGQAAGGFLTSHPQAYAISPIVFISVALLGLVFAFQVKKVAPAGIERPFNINPIKEMVSSWRLIQADNGIKLSVLGLAYFSFLGALFQLNIMVYAKEHLSLDSMGASLLMIVLAMGIGLGGLFSGKVSDQKIELGLVPLGACGLGVMALILGMSSTQLSIVIAALFCLGFSAGFYTVPINAFIQYYSNPQQRGQMLAANNFLSFSAVLLGSCAFYVFKGLLHLSPAGIFIVCGVLTLAGAIYAIKILPYNLVRLLVWTAAHTFYKVRFIHQEGIPLKGGALLIANHTSFIDAVFMTISTERPIRFMMSRDMYHWKPIQWLCRLARVIPIQKDDNPKDIVRALHVAREAIINGELVCIFPEGQLTRTGNMLKFNKGFEHIVKGLDVPIIPVHLDRMWGSVFSFSDGRLLSSWPKIIPYPVTVSVGNPMPASSAAYDVRQEIMELGAESFNHRLEDKMTLSESFFQEMRRRPFAFCVADSSGKQLNQLLTFSLSLAVSKRLKLVLVDQDKVGILLPPSIAGVLANVALGILDKVPVNINYTASKESMASIVSQCQMTTCITSRQFLEKAGISLSCECIYIEDVIKNLNALDYAKAITTTLIIPRRLAHWFIFGTFKSRDHQGLATIMFTSGSTGIPKGVMLTHANVTSNLEGLYQLLRLNDEDRMLGVLPFFHSFGFTGTLWFPLISGMGAVYHYNPLDAKMVGQLVEKHQVTILMATPTFLSTYMRRCEPEQFKSLRLVVVGAEKLKEPLARAFQEKYGVLPMEGYGCTELSPIACVNLPDYENKGVHQQASRMGTIGLPLPGIALRIVNPETGETLKCNEQGLLLVKGPNVMKGYLNQPEKTSEVIQDGWYKTGDIARMDEDGFVTITDRLSRFSKIAGEMVPHIKIEEALQQAFGEEIPVCAVTAVEDDKKGERLAVIYTKETDIDGIIDSLRKAGLPNLWIPSKDMFYKVDSLPLLGTGKLDLAQVKKTVNQFRND